MEMSGKKIKSLSVKSEMKMTPMGKVAITGLKFKGSMADNRPMGDDAMKIKKLKDND